MSLFDRDPENVWAYFESGTDSGRISLPAGLAGDICQFCRHLIPDTPAGCCWWCTWDLTDRQVEEYREKIIEFEARVMADQNGSTPVTTHLVVLDEDDKEELGLTSDDPDEWDAEAVDMADLRRGDRFVHDSIIYVVSRNPTVGPDHNPHLHLPVARLTGRDEDLFRVEDSGLVNDGEHGYIATHKCEVLRFVDEAFYETVPAVCGEDLVLALRASEDLRSNGDVLFDDSTNARIEIPDYGMDALAFAEANGLCVVDRNYPRQSGMTAEGWKLYDQISDFYLNALGAAWVDDEDES
jgi:hypothetical protein